MNAFSPRDRDERLLGQFIPLHYHWNMLQDQARVGAFANAIRRVVQPGMRVVELGGGTGILSFLAAKQGADVYCVERNPALVDAAHRFLSANGVGSSVEMIEGDAGRFVPPEPVDVVICEMLHVGLLREKQLQIIAQFKENYAAAYDGALPAFIPEASLLAVQPVEHNFEFEGYWAPVPLFQAPAPQHDATIQLATPAVYSSICYDEPYDHQQAFSGRLNIEHAGRCNALRFVTKNLLSICVKSHEIVEWSNQFLVLPLEQPIEVAARDRLQIEFAYEAGDPLESLSESFRIEMAPESAQFLRAG